ncbi:alpha/beta hydrolase family protein [Herbidospora sp. RD11066]
MPPFFKDDGFDFSTQVALGAVYHRAADAGEVLATIDLIRDGKPRSWVDAWLSTADRVADEAEGNAGAGRTRSAACEFLRAATYYATATDMADGVGEPGLFEDIWEKHREAWDRFADLTCVERLEIPFGSSMLPGYFFRAGDGRRRTIVYNNGSDGPVTEAWTQCAAEALARGWNVATFDGPGQNAALVRQGLHFRPDWEHVLTPVTDHLLTRADVDGDRLAVMGVSQAGYWVPRALAFEHRYAAAIVDPGVVDVSEAMTRHIPHSLARKLDEGDRAAFDREMEWALKVSPRTRSMLAWRMRPYGLTSFYDFFRAARDYRLDAGTATKITTPMLITDPEAEGFWPGQSRRLYDLLSSKRTLVHFTEPEGADAHCEPMANGLRGERIFDWLDEQVSP